jgi:hypothetical protein
VFDAVVFRRINCLKHPYDHQSLCFGNLLKQMKKNRLEFVLFMLKKLFQGNTKTKQKPCARQKIRIETFFSFFLSHMRLYA